MVRNTILSENLSFGYCGSFNLPMFEFLYCHLVRIGACIIDCVYMCVYLTHHFCAKSLHGYLHVAYTISSQIFSTNMFTCTLVKSKIELVYLFMKENQYKISNVERLNKNTIFKELSSSLTMYEIFRMYSISNSITIFLWCSFHRDLICLWFYVVYDSCRRKYYCGDKYWYDTNKVSGTCEFVSQLSLLFLCKHWNCLVCKTKKWWHAINFYNGICLSNGMCL